MKKILTFILKKENCISNGMAICAGLMPVVVHLPIRLTDFCSFLKEPKMGLLSTEAKESAANIEKRLQLGSKLSDVASCEEDVLELLSLYKIENYILSEHRGRYCVSNLTHFILVLHNTFPWEGRSWWISFFLLLSKYAFRVNVVSSSNH